MERKNDGDVCTQYGISCAADTESLRGKILEAAGLSELFKALSDETRMKILYLLAEQELCVCDLAYLFETNLPAISHHLRLLKMMRLVKARRDGKQVFYSLSDHHVLSLIRLAQEHFSEGAEAV